MPRLHCLIAWQSGSHFLEVDVDVAVFNRLGASSARPIGCGSASAGPLVESSPKKKSVRLRLRARLDCRWFSGPDIERGAISSEDFSSGAFSRVQAGRTADQEGRGWCTAVLIEESSVEEVAV